MMIQRKRVSTAPTRISLKRRKYRGRTYQGLRPIYRGFTPRAFSRGEWKFKDINIAVDINTTEVATLLTGLAPGNGASDRIGTKVDWRSLEIRLRSEATATTGITQFCRWMIVLDRQANGVAPTLAQILLAASTTAPRNLANRKRFKIITDKAYHIGGVLNGAGTGASVPNCRYFKKYLKFRRPITTEYNTGVAGTIADIATNSIYLMALGTSGVGDTDASLAGYIRMRYTDV